MAPAVTNALQTSLTSKAAVVGVKIMNCDEKTFYLFSLEFKFIAVR